MIARRRLKILGIMHIRNTIFLKEFIKSEGKSPKFSAARPSNPYQKKAYEILSIRKPPFLKSGGNKGGFLMTYPFLNKWNSPDTRGVWHKTSKPQRKSWTLTWCWGFKLTQLYTKLCGPAGEILRIYNVISFRKSLFPYQKWLKFSPAAPNPYVHKKFLGKNH